MRHGCKNLLGYELTLVRYVGRVTHRVSFRRKERVELTWYESYLMHDICVNREIGKNYQPMKLLVSEEPVLSTKMAVLKLNRAI